MCHIPKQIIELGLQLHQGDTPISWALGSQADDAPESVEPQNPAPAISATAVQGFALATVFFSRRLLRLW